MSRRNEKCLGRIPSCDNEYVRIKRRLVQAYMELTETAADDNESRTVALGRFGDVEVHLTELSPVQVPSSLPPMWLEVFSANSGVTIDGYGFFNLGEDVQAAAVELIIKAKHRRQHHS